jgi:ABC-type transport system involved in multi-copper enzyme maturation permease subunit
MTQAPVANHAGGQPDTSAQSRAGARLSRPRPPRFPMLAITWRQHGIAMTIALIIIAGTIAILTYSEPILRHIATQSLGRRFWNAATIQSFYGPRYPDLAMQAIPLLIALFVGIPLASRDMEAGTATFAWSQGFSKARWVIGKLTAAACVLLPAAVALGLVFGWWYSVYTPAVGYFSYHAFALYAPALAGWTLAALTMGTMIGVVTRRNGWATWITLAAWILLHKAITVGSPHAPGSDFWPLQFAQLAILLLLSALFAAITIWAVAGTPTVAGMPRLLRSMPWPARQTPGRLAGQLSGARPRMAMVRAAWRQHRTGLVVAFGVLALFALILLITGPHLHAEPARLRPRLLSANVGDPFGDSNAILALPMLLPFVIGALAGASAGSRDLQDGTAAFAWTQGTTRLRWAAGQIILVALLLALAAVGTGLVFGWWNEPYAVQRLGDPAFGLYAPVFAAWTLASYAIAAFLAALTRSVPTGRWLGVAVAVVAAWANATFARPRYLPAAFAPVGSVPRGALLVNMFLGTTSGKPLRGAAARQADRIFNTAGPGWSALNHDLARIHAAYFEIYQPVSRFWAFQLIEAASLLCVATVFAAATIRIILRRSV